MGLGWEASKIGESEAEGVPQERTIRGGRLSGAMWCASLWHIGVDMVTLFRSVSELRWSHQWLSHRQDQKWCFRGSTVNRRFVGSKPFAPHLFSSGLWGGIDDSTMSGPARPGSQNRSGGSLGVSKRRESLVVRTHVEPDQKVVRPPCNVPKRQQDTVGEQTSLIQALAMSACLGLIGGVLKMWRTVAHIIP